MPLEARQATIYWHRYNERVDKCSKEKKQAGLSQIFTHATPFSYYDISIQKTLILVD